jgi:hypothetical protein
LLSTRIWPSQFVLLSNSLQFFSYYGVTDFIDKIVLGGFDALGVTLNRRLFEFGAYDFRPSQGK